MRWGKQWGNFWGKTEVTNLKLTDFGEDPPALLAKWNKFHDGALYHVYVGGRYYDVTSETEIVIQVQIEGRVDVQVFIAGLGNSNDNFAIDVASIPGNRAKLTWTASSSSDLDKYIIHWDQAASDFIAIGESGKDEAEFVTGFPLFDGTHQFRVDPVDEAGNQLESGSIQSIVISQFPAAPSLFTMSNYDSGTNIATFTFTESTSAGVTEYRVYSNGGNGEIDYDTVVHTVLAGNTTFNLTLASSGEYQIAMRAYNDTHEEDNVDVFVEFGLGGSPVDQLDGVPNVPEAFSVKPTAGGKVRFKCNYNCFEEQGFATQINFYSNFGFGDAINYISPIKTFDVSSHTFGEARIIEIEAESNALTDGGDYSFAARSATTNGRESASTTEIQATPDATAPSDISGLTITAVNHE